MESEHKVWGIVSVATALLFVGLSFTIGSCERYRYAAQVEGKTDLSITIFYHGPASGMPDTLVVRRRR